MLDDSEKPNETLAVTLFGAGLKYIEPRSTLESGR